MQRTHRAGIIAGLVVVFFIVANASAMYSPANGSFLNRDPGPSVNTRLGMVVPGPAGQFVQRDPIGQEQYTDSMDLYEYVESQPTVLADPLGLAANPCKTDADAIACMVYAESRGTPAPCEQAVASVILNRVKTRGMSPSDVVSEGNGREFNGYNSTNYANCCTNKSKCNQSELSVAYGNTWVAETGPIYVPGFGQISGVTGDNTGGATYFHNRSMRTPGWIKRSISRLLKKAT